MARHRNVTFEPSRTITSLELRESSIFGGTVEGKNVKKKNINDVERKMDFIRCAECVVICMSVYVYA